MNRVIQSPCQIARSRQGVGKELGVDYRVLESIGDFGSLAETCVSMNQNHQDSFALPRDFVSDIMAVGFSL